MSGPDTIKRILILFFLATKVTMGTSLNCILLKMDLKTKQKDFARKIVTFFVTKMLLLYAVVLYLDRRKFFGAVGLRDRI